MPRITIDTKDLTRNLELYGKNLVTSVIEGVSATMSEAEKESKDKAPWTDRTGNARASIYGSEAELSGTTVIGWHGIGIEYGVYLELAHGGKYRVIWPTIEYEATRVPTWISWAYWRNVK